MPVYRPRIYDDTAIAKQLKQEIKDLEQALFVSRNMTEHYRRLFVDTYAQVGLLNFSVTDLKQKINSNLFNGYYPLNVMNCSWKDCHCSVNPSVVKCPDWYCEGGG